MLEIHRRPDGSFRLTTEVWLPVERARLFPFFAEAANLETLTPPFLGFEILTPQPVPMGVGTLIDYRIRLHGIPMNWRTEITAWEPNVRFIDSQVRGPYRSWVHEHRFADQDGGTLCSDTVDYRVPGGALVHTVFVEKNVRSIFAYRHQKMKELFGASD